MFNQRTKTLRPSPFANYIGAHIKAAQSSLQRLWVAPMATIMTCAVIGIVLTLPMGLFVFLKNIQQISHNLHNTTQISLYLKMNIGENQLNQLQQTLKSDPDIKSIEYISPEDGLKEFQKQSGFGDVFAELQSNPLPGVINIQPRASFNSTTNVQLLLKRLKSYPNVDSAQLDMDWLNRLNAIVDLGHKLAYAIMGLFFFAVLLIISHTIRLMTQHHQDEIRIIKLLGGTNFFIRRPFLYSGMLYGILGGGLASLLILVVILFVQQPVAELSHLYGTTFAIEGLNFRLTTLLFGSGIILGYIGSWIAVTRYISSVDA